MRAGVADVAFATAAMTGRDLRVDRADAFRAARRAGAHAHLGRRSARHAERAWRRRRARSEAAGASVKDVTLPPLLEDAWRAHKVIIHVRSRPLLRLRIRQQARAARAEDRRRCWTRRASVSVDAYDDARRVASRARNALADLMGEYDVILTPSAPGAAPHGIGATGVASFNLLWTLMGTPCVNVPGLSDPTGLPLGVQIVGRFGRDRVALEAALFTERALARRGQWHGRFHGLFRILKWNVIAARRDASFRDGFPAAWQAASHAHGSPGRGALRQRSTLCASVSPCDFGRIHRRVNHGGYTWI